MLTSLYEAMDWALGLNLDKGDLSLAHMCLRAFTVYVVGIALTNINKRFIQINAPFDAIVHFAMGTLAATAIIGGVNFFSTLIILVFLVLLNLLFAILSFYSSTFEHIFFGKSYVLFEGGDIKWNTMKKSFITKKDLLSAMRKKGKVVDLKQVSFVILEHDGEISVIPKDKS